MKSSLVLLMVLVGVGGLGLLGFGAEQTSFDPVYRAVNPSYRVSDSPYLRLSGTELALPPVVPPELHEVDLSEVEDPTAVEIYDVTTGQVSRIPSTDLSQRVVGPRLTSTMPYEGLLPSSGDPRTVFPPDNRVQVSDTTVFPWRTVCKLLITAQDGTQWMGTGAIIGCSDGHGYHVLTAGHCAYLHDHGGWASSIKVIPGLDGGYMPYNYALVTNMRSYTGWTQYAMYQHDWAVLTLDRNVGDFTGWMGRMTADPSDPIYTGVLNTAGYPADKGGQKMYFTSDYGDSADEYNHWYWLDTYGGQSGSPVWAYFSNTGNRYILTVHAYEYTNHVDPNFGTRLNQDKFDRIITWCTNDTPPTDYADLIDDGESWSGFDPHGSGNCVIPGTTSFHVWSDVRNVGTAPSGGFTVSYYASTNTTISPSDYLIGQAHVSSISPFQYADSDWQGTFPSNIPPGTYYVGWIIDSDDNVTEFDEGNNNAYKSSYQLTVCSSCPPCTPGNPSPASDATNVSTSTTLQWSCSGGNGVDSYDVYFGTSSNPPKVGNTTSTSYDPGTLQTCTDYYWKIVAKKSGCNDVSGPVWHFKTGSCVACPPCTPGNPTPANDATNVSASTTLQWGCSGGNGADSYDVYFGTSSNPTFKQNVTSSSYNPGTLSSNTDYYWKVVAKKSGCDDVSSPVWHFKTGNGSCGPMTVAVSDVKVPCNAGTNVTTVSVDTLPGGLSGYIITLTLDPQGYMKFTGHVNFLKPGAAGHVDSASDYSITFRDTDFGGTVQPGATNVNLAEVELTCVVGQCQCESTIQVTVNRLEQDDGSLANPCTQNATAKCGGCPNVPFQSSGTITVVGPSQDLDGDGDCEDITGDGNVGFVDSILLSYNVGSADSNNPVVICPECFDFCGNGGALSFSDCICHAQGEVKAFRTGEPKPSCTTTVSSTDVNFTAVGEKKDTTIHVDTLPTGLAGYIVTLTLNPTGKAKFTGNVNFLAPGAAGHVDSVSDYSITFRDTDFGGAVQPGATNVDLAQVEIECLQCPIDPAVAIEVTVDRLEDDSGTVLSPCEVAGTVTCATDEGLHVHVQDIAGNPIENAWVFAMTHSGNEPPDCDWGYDSITDASGNVILDIDPGTYTLIVNCGQAPNRFLVVREGVTAPGSVTVDPSGTVPIVLTAKKVDGSPLANADIEVQPFCWAYSVGSTDGFGNISFLVTPGVYNMFVWRGDPYYLYQRSVDLTAPRDLLMDASQMDVGKLNVIVSEAGRFSSAYVFPWPDFVWTAPGIQIDLPSGEIYMRANTYDLWGNLTATVDNARWDYDLDRGETAIYAGQQTTVSMGGDFTISTQPDQSSYNQGDTVTISNTFTDAFGNTLWGIWVWTSSQSASAARNIVERNGYPKERNNSLAKSKDWTSVCPHLTVTDPNGATLLDLQDWSLWWDQPQLQLSSDAPEGTYTIRLELDTGPVQGILVSTSQFNVGNLTCWNQGTVQIQASGSGADTQNWFGVDPNGTDCYDALDIPEPPTSPAPYTAVWFALDSSCSDTTKYTKDIKASIACNETKTWTMRVADEGGAQQVTLSWDPQQLPSGGCNGQPPQVTLLDKVTGTVTGMRSSSSYSYTKQSNPETREFTITVSCNPCQEVCTDLTSVGWHMITLPGELCPPCEPWGPGEGGDLICALSDDIDPCYIFRYDPTVGGYVMAPPAENVQYHAGMGFWVRTYEDSSNICVNVTPKTDKTYIPLQTGWNQIGNPFNFEVALSNVTVKYQGNEVSLQQAQQNGWVSMYLFSYDTATGGYRMLNPTSDVLNPWTGYWMRAYVECEVCIAAIPAPPSPPGTNALISPNQLGLTGIPTPPPPPNLPKEVDQGVVSQLRVVNVPNPVRSEHTTTFKVEGKGADLVQAIRVEIYDLAGQKVFTQEIDAKELEWHTNNDAGELLANGVYLYQVWVNIGGTWYPTGVRKLAVIR